MKILEKLSEELTARHIPAELIEDGKVLSLYLSEELTGQEVYGDIFYRPYSEEASSGAFWILRFEVTEVSGLSDEQKSELCNRIATLNPSLMAGGYAYFAQDGIDEEWLLFRMTLPLSEDTEEERILEELLDAAALSARIIKDTIGAFVL